MQRIVRHLTDARDLRILRTQILHETTSTLVHVAVGAVHMPADDVEEVCVDMEAVDHVGDAAREMLAPGIGAEVHVGEPAVVVAVVAPVHPVEVVDVTIDLLRHAAGDLRPARQLGVRGVRAIHRHHLESELLSAFDETTETGFTAHAVGHLVGRIVPVIAAVPRGDEGEHSIGGDLRRHPCEDFEHLREVVEDEAGVVHAVERRREGKGAHPCGCVGARLPRLELERLLDVLRVDTLGDITARRPTEAPRGNGDALVVAPAVVLVDGLDAIGLLARREIEALRPDAIVE